MTSGRRDPGTGELLDDEGLPVPPTTVLPGTPLSVARAAYLGDRIRTLCALRDRLAREIDDCKSGRDLASLTARFTDVLVQIDELLGVEPDVDTTTSDGGLDEFTKRLRDRSTAAPRASGE